MTVTGEPPATTVSYAVTTTLRELRVQSQAAEVRVARGFAVRAAGELGADDDAQDSVRSLVSELVTNVVLHAGTDALVRVGEAGDEHLLVEVVDGSPVMPVQRRLHGANATGRGLRLLKVLAVDSGVEPDPAVAPDGKRVWFRLAKRGDAASELAVRAAAVEQFDVSWDSL